MCPIADLPLVHHPLSFLIDLAQNLENMAPELLLNRWEE
jgi:hypothetical protein